jgi:hypothetical protein
VTNNIGTIKLHDLDNHVLIEEKLLLNKSLFNGKLKLIIVVIWLLLIREEIHEEVLVENNII